MNIINSLPFGTLPHACHRFVVLEMLDLYIGVLLLPFVNHLDMSVAVGKVVKRVCLGLGGQGLQILLTTSTHMYLRYGSRGAFGQILSSVYFWSHMSPKPLSGSRVFH
jgi:hypothetical protein